MNLKKVVVLNSKGGSGKSLVARELVASFRRTATPHSFFNFDGQPGSDAEHEDPEAQVMIADTPARTTDEEIRRFARAADLVVIPTMTGMDDAAPVLHVAQTVRQANPNADVLLVQNSWSRYRLAKDYNGWLHENIRDVDIVCLPRSEMFGQARAAGQSIVDWAPRGKAAQMTLEMVNSVRDLLGFPHETLEK